MPKNLTKAQARQVQEIIDRARRDDGIPRTAQQSIPFQRMFPDGICRVSDKYYTKTIQYQDINYQLAQQEDKTAIFEEWCSFLNFFDSSIHFELSFMNMATDAEVFEKNIRIVKYRERIALFCDESRCSFHSLSGVIGHIDDEKLYFFTNFQILFAKIRHFHFTWTTPACPEV